VTYRSQAQMPYSLYHCATWLGRFINLSLTFLLRCLPTYSPGTRMSSNITKAHIHKLTYNNPKTLNITQINCNTQYNHRKAKSNQHTTVRPVHVCALHCAQLLHTILYTTDLIIFPLLLSRQSSLITVPMMSI